MKSVILTLLCAVFLAGCAGPRDKAIKTLDRVGAEKLRHDAAVLYKDLFAGRGPDLTVLKPGQWPKSFEAFHPLYVGAYLDGFVCALRKGEDTESGIYIIPSGMEHEPRNTDRASYERLSDGIYWYSFHEM